VLVVTFCIHLSPLIKNKLNYYELDEHQQLIKSYNLISCPTKSRKMEGKKNKTMNHEKVNSLVEVIEEELKNI